MKTVFIVAINNGRTDDFLYACATEEKAIAMKKTYIEEYDKCNCNLVIYEELLN